MSDTIAGVEISKPDKVLFPESGLTKRDLCEYYERIADHLLPHIKDRALTLQRFPDGIGADGFYQKSASSYFPDFVRTVELPKEDGTVDYVVCDSKQTLVYLANQGTVTLHPMLSSVEKPGHPVEMIFDLDPSGDDFLPVKQVARAVRESLEKAGHSVRLKTTGSQGLHLIVPLDGGRDFEAVRDEAQAIADEIAAAMPDTATTEVRKENRGDRVYIDTARNAYGQTAVAPYSVRARPQASVATPLEWDELDKAELQPDSYTVKSIFRRLGQLKDPWLNN